VLEACKLNEPVPDHELPEEGAGERLAGSQRREQAAHAAIGRAVALPRRQAERVDAEAPFTGRERRERCANGPILGDEPTAEHPDQHRGRAGHARGEQQRAAWPGPQARDADGCWGSKTGHAPT
jgi:hypothetical protein